MPILLATDHIYVENIKESVYLINHRSRRVYWMLNWRLIFVCLMF